MRTLDTQPEGGMTPRESEHDQQHQVDMADNESPMVNEPEPIASSPAVVASPRGASDAEPSGANVGSGDQPTDLVDLAASGGIASLFTAAAKGFLDPQVVASLVNERHARDLARRESDLRAERVQSENELNRQVQEAQLKRREAEFQATEARWRAERESDHARWIAEVEAESGLDRIRSLVLICVVLAVVATPILGMLRRIDPEDFIQYVTPITAITGTVLGYWFGRQESGLKRSATDRFYVTENEAIKRVQPTRSGQSPLI